MKTRTKVRSGRRPLCMALLVAAPLALCAQRATAGDGVLGDVLEGMAPMSQAQLKDIRGGYAGFYFKVDYAGNVIDSKIDPLSATDPVPTANGDTAVNTTNGNVQISAQVGTLNGTSGVVQIVQVPGSNNVVNAVMNVNMAVINVTSDAAAANVAQALANLYGIQ